MKRQLGLRGKSVLAIILILLVVSAIFDIFFIYYSKKLILDDVEKRAHSIAETLAYNAEYGTLTKNREILNPLIEGIMLQPDVAFCMVGDLRHEYFVAHETVKGLIDYAEPLIHETQKNRHTFRYKGITYLYTNFPVFTVKSQNVSDENLMFLKATGKEVLSEDSVIQFKPKVDIAQKLKPVEYGGSELGLVHLGLSLEGYEKALRKLQWVALLLTLGILIVVGAVVVFMATCAIAPIKEFVKATAKIAKGDLDLKIEIKPGDEIGALAEAFNIMTTSLKDNRSKLEVWSKTLEEKVETRTKELAESKDKLDSSLQEALKSREIMVSMLEDNNQIREQLEEKLNELKKAETALIQSEKLASLGKLVSDMAHEVNNPLMIISGRAQLTLMEEDVASDIKENMDIVIDQCQRAKSIIQRLLLFSKPSKGETQDINVNDVIEFVAKLLEHQFSIINVKIIRKYGEDLPLVKIDEKQMHEVFMNMIKNAADAVGDRGSITMSTYVEDGSVRIDIADDGSGMSEEDQRKIFDPFFTTKEKGTGLGLSVCYGIIQAHGGKLRYKSTLGEGTTASIWLPIKGGGAKDRK